MVQVRYASSMVATGEDAERSDIFVVLVKRGKSYSGGRQVGSDFRHCWVTGVFRGPQTLLKARRVDPLGSRGVAEVLKVFNKLNALEVSR